MAEETTQPEERSKIRLEREKKILTEDVVFRVSDNEKNGRHILVEFSHFSEAYMIIIDSLLIDAYLYRVASENPCFSEL